MNCDGLFGMRLLKAAFGPCGLRQAAVCSTTYGHAALGESQAHGQRLPHEDVGVVSRLEGSLQLLQLPAVEVGPRATPLRGRVLAVIKL